MCIDQLAEVLNYNFPHAWFRFVNEAAKRLKSNQQPISMQIMLKKLILGIGFPILDKPAKPQRPEPVALDAPQQEQARHKAALERFEREQAVYEEELQHVEALPKNRQDLIQTLEDELGLTTCCLSAYIQFKRQSLQHINANLNQGAEQDDNMETQSSLDGDDDKLLNPQLAAA